MTEKIAYKDGIGKVPTQHNLDIFNKHGFCLVKSAVSVELRDFITQYALFDEMQDFQAESTLTPNNAQVPNAHSKYADPAMESMLLHLQDTMEKNTGLKLHPTYSYYRIYRAGDSLAPHKDRAACEISATVCFNYEYDVLDYSWPIYINNTKIVLEPGDMAIYRGCELEHWRDGLQVGENSWHVQGFFHFVDQDGPNAEYKFDKRESIGLPFTTSVEKPAIVNTPALGNKSYIQYT